jgi:anti-sigma B factor antagonist
MSLADFQPVFLALETRDDVVVARLTRAHLSEEDNIEQLARELVMLIDQYGCRRLVLSFAAVDFVTSAALGKVIMVHRRLHREGGRMVLCAVHGTVAEVLHASRLDEYFTIVADDAAAVALLNAAATSSGEG